ncbi:pyridoxamine 5'-phosphate oxidase family protein [Candidatus Hodarchaeum mangrovi]
MRAIRRKEKEIDVIECKKIIKKCKYITLAMSKNNVPYLVTITHGYDSDQNFIYFHCANEGKKLDYIRENNNVWGQALLDHGYQQGKCNHYYESVHFKGEVEILQDFPEKKLALEALIDSLEEDPKIVKKQQLTQQSIENVTIGKIKITKLSGKRSIG